MTFDVRPIAAFDLAAANTIGEEEQWALVAAPSGAVRLAGEDRDPVFAYLCTAGDTVLGWVYGASRPPELGYIAVDRIIVAPQHRKRGVARALMAHVLAAFPDTKVLMAAWEPDMVAFYAALGFHEDDDGDMTNQL
ncbi:GNAT family N-acetyltransferase [Streptomyces sp. NPDC090119]|uniref:GNAT family N-acetyltransferase n=1 Tax=Streptomyces sp. NPDC090119 TaxID=3365951 RepID=UPI0037F8A9D8